MRRALCVTIVFGSLLVACTTQPIRDQESPPPMGYAGGASEQCQGIEESAEGQPAMNAVQAACDEARRAEAAHNSRCDAALVADLVGQAATAGLGAEAMRRSHSARLRWIRPGDVVTMDYSLQRLNIHLDAQNRVDHFACG